MDACRRVVAWLYPHNTAERDTLLAEAQTAASKLVRKDWLAITTLANALLERGTINGDDPIVETLLAAA